MYPLGEIRNSCGEGLRPSFEHLTQTTHGEPEKFVLVNGVKKINSSWLEWKNKNNGLNGNSLAVVTSLADADRGGFRLSDSSKSSIEIIVQDPDYSRSVGVVPAEAIRLLNAYNEENAVPVGCLNMLMGLNESFSKAYFLLDNSGSMEGNRWKEQFNFLKDMICQSSYIPYPPIEIRALNPDSYGREIKLTLSRNGETPESFIEHALIQIKKLENLGPQGGTPLVGSLKKLFNDIGDKSALLYIFSDGEPDKSTTSQTSEEIIQDLFCNRKNPMRTPTHLISCTEQDAKVQWMSNLEKLAPFTNETNDYETEKENVRMAQGDAFPYTLGLYKICRFIGALYPDTLDAIDDPIPFTRWTLSIILGREVSVEEYIDYFNRLIYAHSEAIKVPLSAQENWEFSFNWSQFQNDFIYAEMHAKELDCVKNYNAHLEYNFANANLTFSSSAPTTDALCSIS